MRQQLGFGGEPPEKKTPTRRHAAACPGAGRERRSGWDEGKRPCGIPGQEETGNGTLENGTAARWLVQEESLWLA